MARIRRSTTRRKGGRKWTKRRRRMVTSTGRSRRSARAMNVPRLYPVFPERRVVRLKYHDTINLDPGFNIASHSFSANGLYDPDVTGTGHQPLFFDNMMLQYGRYEVVQSRITCVFLNNKVNTSVYQNSNASIVELPTYGYRCVILADQSSSDFLSNDVGTLIEQPRSNHLVWRNVSPSYATRYPSLTLRISPRKFANRQGYGDLYGTAVANPTSQVYFNLIVDTINPNNLENPPSLLVQVFITYTVQFFDRINAQAEN